METTMHILSSTRKYLRLMIFALFITTAGASAMAAYAHGQQGDDCPKGSTDPDCQKK
jgi:hypothetical protein